MGGALGKILAIVIAAGAAWPAASQSPPAAPDTTVEHVVGLATRYVEQYERELSFLVASEVYRQERPQTTFAGSSTTQRLELRGELFLTYLPVDQVWVAIHDIATVDGRPRPDRPDIRDLLAKGTTASVAREIKARNASFNLGRIERNFNEPTFALRVFEPGVVGRFRFKRESVKRAADGATLVHVSFVEDPHAAQTLVGGRSGPIYARGEATIDASTGVIRRTYLGIKDRDIDAHLETDYSRDASLGMWLPSRFTERWSAVRELILCESRYSNYRRFQTTGRIR